MVDEVRRNSPGYEEDFVAWLNEQARLIRDGDFAAIDRENVAEELESLGRSDYREIESRMVVLLQHLLKLRLQPERATSGWLNTILEQRHQIGLIVRDSPSLRRRLPEAITHAYPLARQRAANEMRRSLERIPETLPFTDRQIFEEDLPEAAIVGKLDPP